MYVWVDGIHVNVRLDDERMCILVVIGATPDGHKERVAVHDGYRESKLSWTEVLRDLKQRGLKVLPALATGDGALGFWAAAEEEFPTMRRQRCWVHKTANILDKIPKGVQAKAKQAIQDMYMVETKKQALTAYEEFLRLYGAKFPAACACLEKDKDDLFTFYDFPAEHWVHLRTTNPIESTFATVRLRTARTKGCGSRTATLTMVYQLAAQAEKPWRRLNKHEDIAPRHPGHPVCRWCSGKGGIANVYEDALIGPHPQHLTISRITVSTHSASMQVTPSALTANLWRFRVCGGGFSVGPNLITRWQRPVDQLQYRPERHSA